MFNNIFVMARSHIVHAIFTINIILVSNSVLAGGIPWVTAYSPCVAYSTAYVRSDIVSDYPGPTYEEIYSTSVHGWYFIDWAFKTNGWIWGGWQYNQAVSDDYSGYAAFSIGDATADGAFWGWNYEYLIWIEFPVIRETYTCYF